MKKTLIKLYSQYWKLISKIITNDRTYISLLYHHRMGYWPNLDKPATFNEKLQWIKLFDHNPLYSTMVDKYLVKKYVASKIGEEYIIPTLGVWDSPENICWDSLPDQFVLKVTHDSGGLIICKDKASLNLQLAKSKLEKSLNRNYYLHSREWPYKAVKHRIIAEKFMVDSESAELSDFKIHCFNGEPKFILVCRDRYSGKGLTEDFYDTDWNHMTIRRPKHPNADTPMQKPAELDEMLRLARVLAKDVPFARTDFYIVNHKIYFGELTFFPASGMTPFIPNEWDITFGQWLKLPFEE